MTSDLLEENQDLRKQIEELKDQIATRNGKIAILNSENERLKAIVLGNEEEISGLKKENAELKAQIEKMKRCEICKNYSGLCGCSYHHLWTEDCKANGMKLFELKENE